MEELDVVATKVPLSVTISGRVEGVIAPGTTAPLNLSFENPNDFPLALGDVAVTVDDIEAPQADERHPCSVDDYAVRQIAGDVVLMIGGEGLEDLRELGLARDHWPALRMVDRPLNQDGCKGATLTLSYEATGTELSR